MTKLPNGRKTVLFFDRCSGNTETSEPQKALSAMNAELDYVLPNYWNYATTCCKVSQLNKYQDAYTAAIFESF